MSNMIHTIQVIVYVVGQSFQQGMDHPAKISDILVIFIWLYYLLWIKQDKGYSAKKYHTHKKWDIE